MPELNSTEITVYEHIYPDLHDWPIYQFGQQRKEFIQQINQEILRDLSTLKDSELDQILAKAIYAERQRVKTNPWKADPPNQAIFFRKLLKEYHENQISDENKKSKNLETAFRLVKRYSEEIAGNFNINTFQFVRKVSNAVFYVLLSKPKLLSLFSQKKMKAANLSRLKVLGNLETIRALFPEHTIVLLPTHSSNLDSILVGYTIDLATGMPAFSYGAGLNLFDSEFFAFFMNRLGAYRVDRRKKNSIYLKTLGVFSKNSIKRGVNTIFFPGGTRSRSGEVEMKLKLGLLNSLIQAQRELLEENDKRKVVIVPVVINYESVLEARDLMIQHLKTTGQEKFTMRDKSPSIFEYVKFAKRLLTRESSVYLTFGDPIDVFGNQLDKDANSFNLHNQHIDLKDYFVHEGKIAIDTQRESIYTKELSECIVKQFRNYNLILPCHIVAFAAFRLLAKMNPHQDMYNLVQIPEEEVVFGEKQFRQYIMWIWTFLKKMKASGKLQNINQIPDDIDELISAGLETLGCFHNLKPLTRNKQGQLCSEDFITLLYYSNKLNNLFADEEINWQEIHLDLDPQIKLT